MKKDKPSIEDYADMLDMPHPVSQRHIPMPREKRAAQFGAFAALSGYDEIIAEAKQAGAAWPRADEDTHKNH